MKKRLFRKIRLLLSIVLLISINISFVSFAIWGEKDGKKFWFGIDGSLAKDGWKLIDDDGDGIGYYYYFDKDGFILEDDITPDYKIVGEDGRRIKNDGNVDSKEIERIVFGEEEEDSDILSAEIMAQVRAEQESVAAPRGHFSSGQYIFAKDPEEFDGPTPADGIIVEVNPDGTARTLLGKNVVLKEKKKDTQYDTSINKNMQEHIKSGDKYSKKVNGTTFSKQKWKDVMALKGTGASIVFENPGNNFNKLKGRIATHNFSYTDRTTLCTLVIFDDKTNEELLSVGGFDYNSGTSFECTFPRKTSQIRFELEVSGQYTSRVCYLRNCEYGFDREAYEEEKYEDDVDAEYRRRIGTESEADYYYDEEETENPQGEIALEGEDPGSRYRRLNGIKQDDEYWAAFNLEEDDDTITAEMRASISEAKRRMDKKAEKDDSVSGPNFDPELQKMTEALGPDGSSRMIEAHEGG